MRQKCVRTSDNVIPSKAHIPIVTGLHSHFARSSTACSGDNVNSSPPISYIHVPILGSRGCGKSTLAQQLVHSTNSPTVSVAASSSSLSVHAGSLPHSLGQSTITARHYYPLVLVNDKIHNLHFIDCPQIVSYPHNSVQEWSYYRGCYLRHASAYILVFDVTSRDSFSYAKYIREQIISDRPNVPIILVANKVDQLCPFTIKGVPMGSATLVHNKQRSELANVIRKQWKGTILVECSAKYDWHVQTVTCELMKMIDEHEGGIHHKAKVARTVVQDVLRRNRCILM